MTESRARYIEARQELYRNQQPKPRTVRCCQCGIEGAPKDMGCVGDNVYKCVYCLLGTKGLRKD